MSSYLIYHPTRDKSHIQNNVVYHDSFDSNQDPYIWNEQFLHSFCHITQISASRGDIIFWVSGDSYPDFTELVCDCVFFIKEKVYWKKRNRITEDDPIVDNANSFEHHYKWVNPPHNQHRFSIKKRYTLKADSNRSFQGQSKNKELIDIVPFLETIGISNNELVNKMAKTRNGKRAINSNPFKLDRNQSSGLYDFLAKESVIKLKGSYLKTIYPHY